MYHFCFQGTASVNTDLRRPGPAFGIMAEWLRRQTRNLMGSALVGSNPADVGGNFCHFADAADRLRPTRIRFASLCHASIVQG